MPVTCVLNPRFVAALLAGACSVAAPGALIAAEGDEDGTEAPAEEAAGGEATPVESVEAASGIDVRRGLFVAGDLGGYFSFGGFNNNVGVEPIPSKSVSNFQPTVGVTLGYDLLSNPGMNLAVGLRLAASYNAGSGVIANPTAPSDFDLYQVGAAGKLGFMVLERLAWNVLLDVGLGVTTPDPTEPARLPDGSLNPNGGSTALGLIFGAGTGVEFYTLFPGFAVGLDVRFQGALAGSEFVPGMSVTVPLKYNF